MGWGRFELIKDMTYSRLRRCVCQSFKARKNLATLGFFSLPTLVVKESFIDIGDHIRASQITGTNAIMSNVTVHEAIEAYLNERKTELSTSSSQNHRYQLKQFSQWCDRESIEELNSIEAIDLSRFRRQRSPAINANTMYNQLSVIRLFLRFAHRMGWVEESLPCSIVLPSRSGEARDRAITADRAGNILDELEKYSYASFDHVLMSLLWTTGARIGTIRAIDTTDVQLSEHWIDIVHRPETDTPLKNGQGSQREINLHGWVCDSMETLLLHKSVN